MFEQRVTLITLGVADVGRARRFYEELGWTAADTSQADIAFFDLSGVLLALYPQTSLSADTGLLDPRPGGITLAYNARSPAEVDDLMQHALAVGGRHLQEARETDWGGYVGYVADPDGHPLEIAYVPTFVPDADGRVVATRDPGNDRG